MSAERLRELIAQRLRDVAHFNGCVGRDDRPCEEALPDDPLLWCKYCVQVLAAILLEETLQSALGDTGLATPAREGTSDDVLPMEVRSQRADSSADVWTVAGTDVAESPARLDGAEVSGRGLSGRATPAALPPHVLSVLAEMEAAGEQESDEQKSVALHSWVRTLESTWRATPAAQPQEQDLEDLIHRLRNTSDAMAALDLVLLCAEAADALIVSQAAVRAPSGEGWPQSIDRSHVAAVITRLMAFAGHDLEACISTGVGGCECGADKALRDARAVVEMLLQPLPAPPGSGDGEILTAVHQGVQTIRDRIDHAAGHGHLLPAQGSGDGPPQIEVRLAEQIARRAHADQKEESTGDDYIHHVERVVAMVDGDQAKAVAWLHDVIEDCDESPDDLRRAGISQRVVGAVAELTRSPGETYADYIMSIRSSHDRLAIAVKLADLRDHLRPNCPERLRPRYEQALATLTAGASAVPPPEEPKTLMSILRKTLDGLPPERVCECGHKRSYHNRMGLSENLIIGNNCNACTCVEFRAAAGGVPPEPAQ